MGQAWESDAGTCGEPSDSCVAREHPVGHRREGASSRPITDAVLVTRRWPESFDRDRGGTGEQETREQRPVLDHVEPRADEIEQRSATVAAMVPEGLVVSAEQPLVRRYRDQCRCPWPSERRDRRREERDRILDVFQHVEREDQIGTVGGFVTCPVDAGLGVAHVVVPIVHVPARDLGIGREVRQEACGEPCIAGADVEHLSGTEGLVVRQDPPVRLEALDLPRVSGTTVATFGQVHWLEATVRTRAGAGAAGARPR